MPTAETGEAAPAQRRELSDLRARWLDLQSEIERREPPDWRDRVEEFLTACSLQGRFYSDPQEREDLQSLAADAAEFYYWKDGRRYPPNASILPTDDRWSAPVAGQPGQPVIDFGEFFQTNTAPSAVGLIGRLSELLDLSRAWTERVHVLVIAGMGGVGKSALLASWVRDLMSRRFQVEGRPIRYGFGWSFYSGGTGSHREGPERFLQAAWKFFAPHVPFPAGDHNPRKSGGAIGARLAELVRAKPALLLLDGLEPLQAVERKHARKNDPRPGQITDPDLAAFVGGLGEQNEGLCVITTRETVADLRDAFAAPAYREIRLSNLTPRDGARLLQQFDLRGPAEEFERAAESVQGHCLSLVLLGAMLREFGGGDIGRWREMTFLPEGTGAAPQQQADHARRVIGSYDEWFARSLPVKDRRQLTPEMALLRMLGFFDGPAPLDGLLALMSDTQIEGLTDVFPERDPDVFANAVRRLEGCGLLTRRVEAKPGAGGHARLGLDQGTSLDAHPLIREYFESVLLAKHPDAARAGHARLYDYFRSTFAGPAYGVDEVMALYRAIKHGCKAGRHKEALDDVMKARVHHDEELWYSWTRLGTFSTELATLRHFFSRPWSEFDPGVVEFEDQHYLWFAVVTCLRALGRVSDAESQLGDYRSTLKRAQSGDPLVRMLGAFVEIDLLRGRLAAAEDWARWALRETAQVNLEARRSLTARLGNVQHLLGKFPEAALEFQVAEALAPADGGSHRLATTSGFYYADYLISQAMALFRGATRGELGWADGEAGVDAEFHLGSAPTPRGKRPAQRLRGVAARMKDLAQEQAAQTPLHRGLTRLAWGEALRHLVIVEGEGDLKSAAELLADAQADLRHAAQMPYLIRGLIALAGLRRMQKRFYDSHVLLEEATSILDAGGIKLYSVDVRIEYAHICFDQKLMKEAREYFSDAKSIALDKEMRYERHRWELDYLGKVTAPAPG